MQTSHAGGVKAGNLLALLSRRRDHTPCWRRSLGRTLPPISFAVEVHGSSGNKSRLKQRPPNSTHLQGRPKSRAYRSIPMAVPWKQISSEPRPLGLQSLVVGSFATPLELTRISMSRSTTNLTE